LQFCIRLGTVLSNMEIEWLGDSLAVVNRYSKPVRKSIGFELRLLQNGAKPIHARPLKTVGRGVWEIKVSEKEGQFRLVYLARRRDRIYVLHAFQKKTRTTPKQDIDLAKRRLKEI